MSKRLFGVLLCMLLVLLTGSSILAKTITINFATILNPGEACVEAMELFKQLVEERSNGRIIVQNFPGGVMGGERDNLEALASGALEMACCGVADAIFYAPEYYIVELPYVMKDRAHVRKVWAGPVGEEVNEAIRQKKGIRTIAVMDRGPRYLTSNRPIYKPEDVKGLRMRLPENTVWMETWKALGAQPMPIAFPEIFTALQTGMVEAQENPLQTIYNAKFHEVQKYLIGTLHVLSVYKFQASDSWWNSLSPDDQKLLQEAMDEASVYGNKLVEEGEEELLRQLQEDGITYIEVDIDKFRAALAPTLERLGREFFKEGLYDKVLAEAEDL